MKSGNSHAKYILQNTMQSSSCSDEDCEFVIWACKSNLGVDVAIKYLDLVVICIVISYNY